MDKTRTGSLDCSSQHHPYHHQSQQDPDEKQHTGPSNSHHYNHNHHHQDSVPFTDPSHTSLHVPTSYICDKKTTFDSITTTATTANMIPHEHDQFLQELRTQSKRLHLLSIGMLILGPSLLPYLTSSVSAIELGQENTTMPASWIPWIPCLGIWIPLMVTRAIKRIESCKSKKGRGYRGSVETRCPLQRLRRCLMRRTRFGSTEQSLKDLNGVAIQDLYDHEHDHKCLDEHEHKHEQYDCHDKTVSMMLPRPRTILLTSLGIWTLLLVLAPQMGLNRSVSVTVWSVDGYDSMMMVSDTISQQQEQQEQYKYENGFDKEWSTGTVWDDEVFQEELEARVRAAEEDDIMDSEGFYLPPKSEQGSQFMEYMEVDFKSEQDDLSALRDFWNAQEEIVTEGYEPMVPSHSDKSTLLTTISGNLDEEVDDQNNYTSNEVVRFIRLFEYKPWWTEGFMFSLALCLGGMLVGLHLAKMEIRGRIAALEKELEDDVNHHDGDVKDQKKARVSNLSRRRRIAAFTWVRGLLTVALLGMNYWMVKSRHWDLPSLYFAGLGCAGMLLVHLWLPKTPDQYVLDSNEKHTITGYLSV